MTHFMPGSRRSQQPACGSPNYQHVTETPEEEDTGKEISAIWKSSCLRKLRVLQTEVPHVETESGMM